MSKERQKARVGRVVSTKMDKTVLVAVQWQKRHPIYKKSLRQVTKFFAHDKDNECRLGDLVRIQETRPLSRMKRWRVIDVLERHEVAEVKPIDLDEGILTEEAEREGEEEDQRADESVEEQDEDQGAEEDDDEDVDEEGAEAEEEGVDSLEQEET